MELGESTLSSLPVEILVKIFSWIDLCFVLSLRSVSTVCCLSFSTKRLTSSGVEVSFITQGSLEESRECSKIDKAETYELGATLFLVTTH